MNPKISVVSLNYNRLKFTKEHIENLFDTTDVPFELLVVSNYDDSVSAEVRKYIKTYQYDGRNKKLTRMLKILNNKNYGVAGGRNSGLIHAKAPYKIVIDDDILMPPKWTSKLIRLFETVDIIGVAGYCVEKERAARKYKLKTYNGCIFKTKGRDNIGGACFCIPPRTWKKLGYFNESYPSIFGFEDADYGSRVAALARINAYVHPELAVQQKDNINTRQYHEWKVNVYKNSRARNLLATNILRYQSGRGIYIGEDKLKNKWSDLY
jgi:GT2 family glycosyltransferase